MPCFHFICVVTLSYDDYAACGIELTEIFKKVKLLTASYLFSISLVAAMCMIKLF